MGTRLGMRFRAGLLGPRELARPRLAESPEEFIQWHHLEDAVRVARELAVEHFGDRFTSFTCKLHVEDWYEHLEVEVGTSVALAKWLEMRRAYLNAFELACPDVSWDRFQLSVW